MVEAIESLKDNILLSAANTFTEEQIRLSEVSMERRKAMLIHEIAIELTTPIDHDQVNDDDWLFQICSSEEGAEVYIDDKDCVFKAKERFRMVQNAAGEVYETDIAIKRYKFNPPLPYLKDTMYIGAKTTGQDAAQNFRFEILHTYGFLNPKQAARIISRKF